MGKLRKSTKISKNSRKYLDDIRVFNRPELWGNDTDRSIRKYKWSSQREVFGFDERETWNLRTTFYLWLYERLKMYLDTNIVDLTYHKFYYNGVEYNQRQMIDMMIERLEYYFSDKYEDIIGSENQYVAEIEKIWAIVLPAMWW